MAILNSPLTPRLPQPSLFSSTSFSPRPRSLRMGSSASTTRASSVAGFAPATADALADVSIVAAQSGEPVLFRDLWDQNEGVAVVAFMRHFGCFCSWDLASDLRDSISKFDQAGAKVIVVGIGSADNARVFAERLPFPLDFLYADPERKAYDILGFYYGLGRTFFNPASVKVFSRYSSVKKATKNFTLSVTPDDKSGVLQQGGMLVFKGKQLLYARKDEGTGDHAPLDEILDICCKAPDAAVA